MSDDLRTRIAAIQRTHREELCEENVCICGYHGDYPKHVADAVIFVVQPLLEAEYNRGYDEGVDWLHDESRWIKREDKIGRAHV